MAIPTRLNKNHKKNNEITTALPPSAVVTTTADSWRVKPSVPKAKSVMDARVAKKELEKGQASKNVKWKQWTHECDRKTKTIIE